MQVRAGKVPEMRKDPVIARYRLIVLLPLLRKFKLNGVFAFDRHSNARRRIHNCFYDLM